MAAILCAMFIARVISADTQTTSRQTDVKIYPRELPALSVHVAITVKLPVIAHRLNLPWRF